MIRIIDSTPKPVAKTKPMYEMQPLEVCVTVDEYEKGDIVMRTASITHFEVMNLTDPYGAGCWVGKPGLKVRELYPGETYTIELS
mgnify:CR=1 FL=1